MYNNAGIKTKVNNFNFIIGINQIEIGGQKKSRAKGFKPYDGSSGSYGEIDCKFAFDSFFSPGLFIYVIYGIFRLNFVTVFHIDIGCNQIMGNVLLLSKDC